MSYSDLLQSYQDRITSMAQNEDSVGDYLLNKAQDKMNSYLEQTGVPAQIGAVLDQVGILANNSAVKTLLEKSGLKGVVDQQLETLNSTVSDLKDQIKTFGEKASAAVDRQVANARDAAQPILERTQQAITTGRQAEQQVRAGVEAAQELPGQVEARITEARQQGEELVGRAREAGEEALGQAREQGEQLVAQARTAGEGAVENLTQGAQAAVERTVAQATPRFSPEYLQNLSDAELKDAYKQIVARKTELGEQFRTSELPNREEVFQRLKQETLAEKQAYLSEAERRGLYQREQQPTSGVSEEPNVRPSEVPRDLPEFQAPTQQLPQVPQQQPAQPEAPEAPAQRPAQAPSQPEAPEAPAQRPAQAPSQPEAPRPQPSTEVEPAVQEGEQVIEEGEKVASTASNAQKAISTTAKVGTGLEETTGEIPGLGEVTEVVGALLQIGSLIASAFKPHESTPIIQTPVTGFGFGSMSQFGVGGSSIV